MCRSKAMENVKLSSFDDLFGGKDVESSEESIQLISLAELSDFEGHPFKIHEDELEEMVESIKQYGVLMPGIVRRKPYGGYEIIAGHTRKRACELAGLNAMPVIVRELDDDEATVLMVDSNIQREDVFPSEKARAYKMKYAALKNQGHPGNSLQQIGEENGDSSKQVQRYIYLANLTDELLQMVDDKRLGFTQGVDLSWLSEDEQKMIYKVIDSQSKSLSTKESAIIKQLSKDGKLEEVTVLRMFLSENKTKRKVTLPQKVLDQYFSPAMSDVEINEILISLLDKWKEEQEE